MFIDTHAHLNYENKYGDLDRLVAEIGEAGVKKVICVGWDLSSSALAAVQAERYPSLYFAAGFHPSDLGDYREGDLDRVAALLSSPKGVAVGEIGLDYYWDQTKKELQKKWFAAQLALAAEEKHPVVVHSRDAASDTLELMRSEYGKRPACIHCFSYSREMAEEFLKLDYRIGIGGVVTFKNAKKIREVVEYLPMDRILLETDCPYLAPEPNRGKRNSSLNLPFVIRQTAETKGIDPQEVEETTCRNAKEFFGIGTGA